jgi:hypothetical protein
VHDLQIERVTIATDQLEQQMNFTTSRLASNATAEAVQAAVQSDQLRLFNFNISIK